MGRLIVVMALIASPSAREGCVWSSSLEANMDSHVGTDRTPVADLGGVPRVPWNPPLGWNSY